MHMRSHRQQIEQELLSLREGGLLKPRDVVDFAKNPDTALHAEFPWDDAKAADEHRLSIARRLIVSVRIIPYEGAKPTQAFVSLVSDRKSDGGYREVVDVLSKGEQRQELLEQAFREFNYWKAKYESFGELREMFAAGERAEKTYSRKAKKNRRPQPATV